MKTLTVVTKKAKVSIFCALVLGAFFLANLNATPSTPSVYLDATSVLVSTEPVYSPLGAEYID